MVTNLKKEKNNIRFNTLYWDNVPEFVVDAHKAVCDHFNLDVTYYQPKDFGRSEWINHSDWMNLVCDSSKDEIVCFLDIDCIPLNEDALNKCFNYVKYNDTFLGIAQTSNHHFPAAHVYAGPAFFMISRECLNKFNKISKERGHDHCFKETSRSDVAEEITYMADECRS